MWSASLVNGPFGDPVVYAELKHRREAILFDLGDISALQPRKILKVKSIFVSHTHVDHFIGFDHLLRICLGRDLHISLFGPPDFLAKIEHKLQAYTWNLVGNFTNEFALTATEVHPDHRVVRHYRCRNAFRAEGTERLGGGTLLFQGNGYSIHGVLLDHSVPCLALRFEEEQRINIKKNGLQDMGLPTGRWIDTFKEQILRKERDEAPVRIWWKTKEGHKEEKSLPLGLLKDRLVKITPGHRLCYISDVVWNEANVRGMVALAKNADSLFIEAAFLHEERDRAAQKYHLTAHQAGRVAAMAGVKRMTVFHYSPKYKGLGDGLQQEALMAFVGGSTPMAPSTG